MSIRQMSARLHHLTWVGFVFLFLMILAGPSTAEESWNVDFINRVDNCTPQDIVVDDNIAYVASDGFLAVLDVSDVSTPVLLTNYETPDRTVLIDKNDNLLYTTGYNFDSIQWVYESYLRIFDVSQPDQPVQLSEFYVPGYAQQLQVSGSFVFVVTTNHNQGGFFIIDVSDPTEPVQAYFNASDGIISFFATDTTLYTCNADSTFTTYDLPDHSNPQLLGSCEMEKLGYDVYVENGLAYAIGFSVWNDNRIQIFDVNDPQNPTFVVGHALAMNMTRKIFVRDTLAYINDTNDLGIFDVSDPLNIAQINVWDDTRYLRSFFIKNDKLYVVDENAGIGIIDITDPHQLWKLAFTTHPDLPGTFF
ncbi:MAG: hypothetical protein B6244_14455 [Candidatus Cloacimonetes bacterium 4572_55]|nr:MAG: hypothetical protein B6244_14455 [Candidatus Cloacimonetes bacterium 4572_55]